MTDVLTAKFLTRPFLQSHRLKKYSLAQVGQGIWFLVGESSPAQPAHALLRREVALRDRMACIHAMTEFFRSFVAPAAPGQVDVDSDPFHIACYMWWDIFPTWGGPNSGEPEIHAMCLRVMSEVLDLPSDLCRLSALHGLNHWHLHHREQVVNLIGGFLAKRGNLSPRIREYASSARQASSQLRCEQTPNRPSGKLLQHHSFSVCKL